MVQNISFICSSSCYGAMSSAAALEFNHFCAFLPLFSFLSRLLWVNISSASFAVDLMPFFCQLIFPLSVAGELCGRNFSTVATVSPGHVMNCSFTSFFPCRLHWAECCLMQVFYSALVVAWYPLLAQCIWFSCSVSSCSIYSGPSGLNGRIHSPVVASCFPCHNHFSLYCTVYSYLMYIPLYPTSTNVLSRQRTCVQVVGIFILSLPQRVVPECQ